MRISLLGTARTAPFILAVSASGVGAQSAPIPQDTVISLERTACGGECPAYRVSIDARGNVVYEFKRNIYGATALGWAAHLRSDVAALLLRSGVPVDDPQDEEARTPLWSAACAGNADVVAVLLAAGANPATRNTLGVSARDCAKMNMSTDAAQGHPPWVQKP